VISTRIIYTATLAVACVASAACTSTPGRSALHREVARSILYQDARLTHAYNQCELQTLHRMFSANGAMYLADGRIQSPVREARDAVCGKWRREVVPGSLHVYPLNTAAAIQVGEQRFCPMHTQSCDTRPAEFVAVWLYCDLHWQITDLISFPPAPR
jgi:hypothetical protein